MDRTLLKTLLAAALILAVVWLLGSILMPFLVPIAWALIIGIITYPAYLRLLKLLNQHEHRAAAIMTLAVVLLCIAPVLSLLSVLAQEVGQVYVYISNLINDGGADKLLQQWGSDPRLAPHLERIKTLAGRSNLNLTDSVITYSKQVLSQLLLFLTALITNSFAFLLDTCFMLFILFFVYLDGRKALAWLDRVLPIEAVVRNKVSLVIQNVLSGFIFGTLLTSLVQGVLAGAAYLLFNVPSACLLAVLTAIAGLIPVVGTAIIWLPAALYLYFTGAAGKAVVLALWGLVVVGMADNVVKPLFMSSRVTLPLLPLLLGAFGGLAAFGVLGAILGPLLLAILYELFVLEDKAEELDNTTTIEEGAEADA